MGSLPVEFVVGLIGSAFGAAASYFGALAAMRVEIAKLDQRLESHRELVEMQFKELRRDFDSDHAKLDAMRIRGGD